MPTPFLVELQSRLSDDEQRVLIPYLMTSERGQPIAFEGRHDVRDFIKGKIAQVRSGDTPEDCNTVIISGAPGAGKSSLLRQIQKEMSCDSVNHDVIPIFFEVSKLNDPVQLLEMLLARRRVNFEGLSKSYTQDGKGRINLKLLQSGGGIYSNLPALDTSVRESPGRIWNVIRQSLYPGDDPIFLLLIDEAQRIGPKDGESNTLLTDMHGVANLGGLKIIPVFAGLSDTGHRLKKAGITRPADKDFKLRFLEAEEGISVCRGTFKALHVDKLFMPNDIDTVCMYLDNASDGWPRHLHHYVRYFVDEVLKSHNHGRDQVDLNRVLDLGHDNTIGYYQDRLSETDFKLASLSLNDIAKQSSEQIPITIKTFYDALEGVIDPTNVEPLVHQYVHDGIFDENPDGTYEFPIPSLETFLANDRDVEATKKALQDGLRA